MLSLRRRAASGRGLSLRVQDRSQLTVRGRLTQLLLSRPSVPACGAAGAADISAHSLWWLWEFTRDERCGDRVAKVCLDSDCSCVACENRKGVSRSAKPYRRSAPSAEGHCPERGRSDHQDGKKGHTPSQSVSSSVTPTVSRRSRP